jgi:REP element-mobilizing transposase RayT
MHLNEIGEIAEQKWIKPPEMRPDMNLELDAFVIMPNHFHGIIIIGKNQYNSDNSHNSDNCRDAMHCVSTEIPEIPEIPETTEITKIPETTENTENTDNIDTTNSTDTPNPTHTTPNFPDISVNVAANKFKPQLKNLASIIRGFKSAVTTQAKRSGNCDFVWQSRYHEHIIRNISEFYRIRKYIIDNPANPENDNFYGLP